MAEFVSLRADLVGMPKDAPWRQIAVSLDCSFKHLHDVLQAAFDFQDCHLWKFHINDRRLGPQADDDFIEDRKIEDANLLLLSELKAIQAGQFTYTYDFGDNWEFDIKVDSFGYSDEQIFKPKLVDGAFRPPPEDVGGVPGFLNFIEAMNDPNHEEHGDCQRWFGAKTFNAKTFNKTAIVIRLKQLTQ